MPSLYMIAQMSFCFEYGIDLCLCKATRTSDSLALNSAALPGPAHPRITAPGCHTKQERQNTPDIVLITDPLSVAVELVIT